MKRFMIIGAGKSGRGFIARLLYPYGHIVFVDKNADLVRALSDTGSYTVSYFTSEKIDAISDYISFSTNDQIPEYILNEICCIFISVGYSNVPSALSYVNSLFKENMPHIFICENGVFSRDELPILKEHSSLGLIFCSTLDDGINIKSEDFNTLYLDDTYIDSNIKHIPGLSFTPDVENLIERKIYTYNAASAVIGFSGKDKGYAYLHEAANDPEIARDLDAFYRDINYCMCQEFGIPEDEQKNFSDASRSKFKNRYILDSIDRNIRNPLMKLTYNERLIGSFRYLVKYDRDIEVISRTIISALKRAGIKNIEEARNSLMQNSGLSYENADKILAFFK